MLRRRQISFTYRRRERRMERLKAWLRGTSFSFAPEFVKPMATTLIAAAVIAFVSGSAEAATPVQASCHLGNKIKRVVFLTFDNVHLRRDNPNVPSDLEQMPHLLNFLQENGTVSGNHFTPLISHRRAQIGVIGKDSVKPSLLR